MMDAHANAQSDHRHQQPVGIAYHQHGQQAGRAHPQVDLVRAAHAEAPHEPGNDERRQRAQPVVSGEQHADPVGAGFVGRGTGCARAEMQLRDRGRGVDEDREQREPGEELHQRQPARRCGHGFEFTENGREGILALSCGWPSAGTGRRRARRRSARRAAGVRSRRTATARPSASQPEPHDRHDGACCAEDLSAVRLRGRVHRISRASRADIRACR